MTDKIDKKYSVLLKLLNTILTNLDKPNITYITEFKNIDREDIIKEETTQIFTNLSIEIFSAFDKKLCGWYRRNQTKAYILVFLRYATTILKHKLIYKQKTVMVDIGNKRASQSHLLYSI